MNSNAVPATIWFCLELIRYPKLMARGRSEISTAQIPNRSEIKGATFDLTKLCEGPILQSSFAEVLRLYMTVALMRAPIKGDFMLGRWRFPKDKIMVLSSRTAHHNTDVWNTGTPEDPHPIDEFWADRFLVYPNDPNSGPLKKAAQLEEAKAPRANEQEMSSGQPTFTMEGTSGAWVPFGGGAHMCPGRFFAKNEMLASFAMMTTEFDIELVEPNCRPEPDIRFFPVGMLPPKGKIPFRIRRRKVPEVIG